MASDKKPAFQFYPGDWMKDPALRRCTAAARGVWMDLICLAHECPDRGRFTTNGTAWPLEDLARALCGDLCDNLCAIRELVDKGVLKQDEVGTFYVKRVVQDERKRALCGEAGKKGGGNPNLKSKGARKGALNGEPKQNQKASSSSSSSSSSSNNNTPPTPSNAPSVVPDPIQIGGGEAAPVGNVPAGGVETPAFPPPRSGRLTFDRRMLPVPASHAGSPFEPAWNRWLDHRIAKCLVTTEDEARGMLMALCRSPPADAAEIIRRTIEEKGWSTLDLPKQGAKSERSKRTSAGYDPKQFTAAGDAPI